MVAPKNNKPQTTGGRSGGTYVKFLLLFVGVVGVALLVYTSSFQESVGVGGSGVGATNSIIVNDPMHAIKSSSSSSSSISLLPSSSSSSSFASFFGDGEITLNSHHTFNHRPLNITDPRDVLLMDYDIYPCSIKEAQAQSSSSPNTGLSLSMVGMSDEQYEHGLLLHSKFICYPGKLKSRKKKKTKKKTTTSKKSTKKDCIIYSFGDELTFEIGMNNITDNSCDIHIFNNDYSKLRNVDDISQKYNFIRHEYTIGGVGEQSTSTSSSNKENSSKKTLLNIMKELKHKHINILKIDIEGSEKNVIPNLYHTSLLKNSIIDQISIEFHGDIEIMKTGLDALTKDDQYVIVYARKEDRCSSCTEITLLSTKLYKS